MVLMVIKLPHFSKYAHVCLWPKMLVYTCHWMTFFFIMNCIYLEKLIYNYTRNEERERERDSNGSPSIYTHPWSQSFNVYATKFTRELSHLIIFKSQIFFPWNFILFCLCFCHSNYTQKCKTGSLTLKKEEFKCWMS